MTGKDKHRVATNAAGVPEASGLYDPANDHDSCGVGFVARLDGVPQHNVVEDAVRALVNLEHRGAVGGDMSTGDGAGILMQIPDLFLRQECHCCRCNVLTRGLTVGIQSQVPWRQ